MALTSPLLLVAAGFLLLAIGFARRLASPLRHVPGPFVSRITSLVLRWKELRLSRTLYIHELHKRYGPVVRVSPDEVSFTSWTALREIYSSSGSGFDKTEWYDLFKALNRRTMFTILTKADHAKRKRLVADRYANSNILKGESLGGIKERAARFVQRCTTTTDGVADIFMALHSYACDCVTFHLFHPHGTDCLRNGNDEAMMHQVSSDNSAQPYDKDRMISYYFPTIYRIVSKILPYWAPPRETPLADQYVLKASGSGGFAEFSLMSRFDEKTDQIEYIDKAAECMDHFAAGIETTGNELCFIMGELSRPRSAHLQQRLIDELRQNPDAPNDQLPFLEALIWEGLRCFPAIPMTLPRFVPPGGHSIDGYWLPENTRVGCQSWSVHLLNDDVFPEPARFNPDRWLEIEGDAERKRLLFTFSTGGRGCVGKHLALAEMKTLLRSVYSEFRTTTDPSVTDESMAFSEQLISANPRSEKCLLRFHRLEEESFGEKGYN